MPIETFTSALTSATVAISAGQRTRRFRSSTACSVRMHRQYHGDAAERCGSGAGRRRRLRIEGGQVRHAAPQSAPLGTTVEVRSLFFNVPARRNFLKRPQTELRRCLEVVQGYALVRSDVDFVLQHEGRELIAARAAGADPASRRQKGEGLFLGFIAFFLFSTLRLVALGIVGQLMPQWVQFSHVWLMMLINTGFAVFIWMCWVNRVRRAA